MQYYYVIITNGLRICYETVKIKTFLYNNSGNDLV